MKHAPTLVLALAATAALLVPVLVPRECGAQEKPPAEAEPQAVARTTRLYDVAGIRSPSAAHTGAVDIRTVRPFGYPSKNNLEEPEVLDTVPGTSQIIEIVRSLLGGDLAETTEVRDVAGGILVHAPAESHRRVEQALDALRRSEGAPYELSVRSATLEDGAATDALLAEVEAAPGGVVPDDLVRRVLAADRDSSARVASVAAHDGRWTSVESVRTRNVVTDWDVEIAQAASIADPVPQQVEDGLRAAIRAGRMQDGRAIVSVAAATADAVEPFRRTEMRTKDLGSAEMPEVRGGWATSATPMRVGDTVAFVMASPVSARAAVRRVLFVRLTSAPPAPDLPSISIVPIGAITVPWAQAFLRVPGREPTRAETFRWGLELEVFEGADLQWDQVVEAVKVAAPAAFEREGNVVAHVGDWPGGGAVVVQGEAACREAGRTAVSQLERDRVRAAHVSVRLVARTPDGDRTLGMLSAPAILGRNVAMAAYTSVPYVGDYDVEVAQEARIADPLVMSAVGGSVLNVLLSQGPGTALRADLDLTSSGVGDVESSSVGATEVGVIERVTVRRARAAQGVIIEAGKSKEIDLGANPWGAGRLVAVLRAERVGER